MSLNESIVEDATLRDTLLPKLLSGDLSVGMLQDSTQSTV